MKRIGFDVDFGLGILQRHAVWLVLLLLLLVAALVSDAFLRPSYLLNTLRQVSNDLKTNNTASLQNGDIASIDSAVDNINNLRATVGARSDRLRFWHYYLQPDRRRGARWLSWCVRQRGARYRRHNATRKASTLSGLSGR